MRVPNVDTFSMETGQRVGVSEFIAYLLAGIKSFNRHSEVEVTNISTDGMTIVAQTVYVDHVYRLQFNLKTIVKSNRYKPQSATASRISSRYDDFSYDELKCFDKMGYTIHPAQTNETKQKIYDWWSMNS